MWAPWRSPSRLPSRRSSSSTASSHDAEHAALAYHFYEWFSLTLPGGTVVPINVRFLMDSLSGVMTLVVTGVGGLIHLYSIGYMGEDDGLPEVHELS